MVEVMERTVSPSEYLEIVLDNSGKEVSSLDELREHLDRSNRENLWDFPIEELRYLREQLDVMFSVVLVECNGEQRYFETR